jgi:hypothetical protein
MITHGLVRKQQSSALISSRFIKYPQTFQVLIKRRHPSKGRIWKKNYCENLYNA